MDEPPVPGAPGDNYDTLSKAELKDLLRTRGLNVSGNTQALISRLRRGTN
jgi:hypothetical protein